MHRLITVFACFALLTASSALAISPSDDLLIAAAARTSAWTADLYIVNPNTTAVTVDVMWLERGQANPSPQTVSFEVSAGETLILDDVLLNNFGMNRATGALHITADGEVTANLIVYTGAGSPDGTYGSGFEAIPASSATSIGESTTLSGVALDDDFYSNLFALAGADGVIMDLDLLDPDGTVLDTVEIVLEAYEPWLSAVSDLWNVPSFASGTVKATVTDGSMVMLGSKVDRLSKDPTTLEQAFDAGGGLVDGEYVFTIWDLGYGLGSSLRIVDGEVVEIYGTYENLQKEPECPWMMHWGQDFYLTGGVPVEDFETGFEFTDDMASYYDDLEAGEITWTVKFTMKDNIGFTGSIVAVGANFTGADIGCNGAFPELLLWGGKSIPTFGGKK